MSGVEAGVDRIVDQIVNPKLNSTFLPEVETVIYNCFGTTKAENEEEDLLNGNDDHSKNGDAHDQSIGGKISTRNLSTISSDTEMLNVEKTSVKKLTSEFIFKMFTRRWNILFAICVGKVS